MFALISPVCTNSIGSYYLLYHRFGKKSMYKLHKISQRFLCRIPIYSKQGAPGPPARLCAMVHVYLYSGTPTPIPLYPMPTTYIHACINTFVLFIYLIVFVFVYLIVFVSLTLLFSLALTHLALSLPLARPAIGYGQQVLSLFCEPIFYFI